MLNFNYMADARKTLYDNKYLHSLALQKRAGVTALWLTVCMTGKYCAEQDEIISAKRKLEDMGFAVNALILPVGHPGNSLNPEEDLDLRLPEHWNYRVNAAGEKEYFCACVDDTVIRENKAAVEFCRDAGFEKLFFDDDLRMGNHGDSIRGCYCENCLEEFAALCGKYYTREEIANACETGAALSEKWIAYNCSKITRFMTKTATEGIQTGIMVMHNGGRYHGIDIPEIKKAVPDCLFRVGELQFDDVSFESDIDHDYELTSMKLHLALVGDPTVCYSETTVFPPRALSPENLVKKTELAIRLGIRNIFLMSGTWFLTDDYWYALIENLPRFRQLAEVCR